jgi:hypothetical protein
MRLFNPSISETRGWLRRGDSSSDEDNFAKRGVARIIQPRRNFFDRKFKSPMIAVCQLRISIQQVFCSSDFIPYSFRADRAQPPALCCG